MTIHQLYTQIYSNEANQAPEVFIEIYERNKELIEGLTINGDQDFYNKVLRLTSDYSHNLTTRESYQKALPHIDKALGLFNAHPAYFDTDLFKLQFYETLVFDRAMSNYYVKNNKEAKNDLKKLAERFPTNDKYRIWLAAAQTHSLRTLTNVLWYIIAAAVLISAIFDREDIGLFSDLVLYLGVIALIMAVAAEVVELVKKRRIKNGS